MEDMNMKDSHSEVLQIKGQARPTGYTKEKKMFWVRDVPFLSCDWEELVEMLDRQVLIYDAFDPYCCYQYPGLFPNLPNTHPVDLSGQAENKAHQLIHFCGLFVYVVYSGLEIRQRLPKIEKWISFVNLKSKIWADGSLWERRFFLTDLTTSLLDVQL